MSLLAPAPADLPTPTPTPASRPAPEKAPGGARDGTFDVLRGFFLVLMAINHVPWALWYLTQQSLGFVTAAEGFVLLAGLLVGLIYTRKFKTLGKSATTRLLVRRAGVVYFAHALCLLGAFAWVWLYWWFADRGHPPIGSPWIFQERPWEALAASFLLLMQPGLLDVLPMYFGFLLLTPMVLRQLMRGRMLGVLIGCGLCWGFTNLFIPSHPIVTGLVDTSAFNFGSWQLLYVLGLIAGHLAAEGRTPAWMNPGPRAALGLLAVALLLALLRHGVIPHGLSAAVWEGLTNKNDLAPLRLLNVAVLALLLRHWVLRRACAGAPDGLRCAPLALLGRHSLSVFSTHVVVALVIIGLPWQFEWTRWGPWVAPVILVAAMFGAALLAEGLAARRRGAQSGRVHP